MPSPIQRLGNVRLAQPTAGPNPEQPSTSNPPLPTWMARGGDAWQDMHPSEHKRFKEMKDLLDDQRSFFVSVGHGADGISIMQGMFGMLDSVMFRKSNSPKTALPIHKPVDMAETDFNTCRFGIPVQNLDHFRALMIGGMPASLLNLAKFGIDYNVDLFDPSLMYTGEHGAELARGERRKRDAEDIAKPGEKLVDDIEWKKRNSAKWLTNLQTAIRSKKVNVNGQEMTLDFGPPPNPRAQNTLYLPISLGQAKSLYATYLKPEYEPLIQYAQNICVKALENPANEEKLIGMINGYAQQGIPIPLDRDFTSIIGHVPGKEAAQSIFFAGNPPTNPETNEPRKEILFLDLSGMDGAFSDTFKGTVSNEFRELLQKIDDHRKKTRQGMEYRKCVMFSPASLKTGGSGPGEPSAGVGGVKTYDLKKPDADEIEHLVIPQKLFATFGKGGLKAVRGNKPVELFKLVPTADGKTQYEPTAEYYSLLKEMSRYSAGFSARGLNEFLSEIFQKTSKESYIKMFKPTTERPAPELGGMSKTLDLDFAVKWMRDSYVDSLFSSYGDAEGAAIKEQFVAVDIKTVKPNGMRNPAKVEEYLKNVKRIVNINRIVGDETIYQINQLKAALQALKTQGIDIDPMTFDIFSTRYQKGPDGKPLVGPDGKKVPINPLMTSESMIWDELTDADLDKVRKAMAATLKAKLGNFLLLSGPGGTGKTSTAAYLAEALNYGFMLWNMCRSQNMWVGETARRSELAFKFVMNLREYVVLLDEIDFCLGGEGGPGGKMSGNDKENVIQAFRTNWKFLEEAAPKNNLIIVSTTNEPESMKGPNVRRLQGGESIEVGYLKEKEDLDEIASVIIDRYKNNPGYPTFSQLKQVYGDALYREANSPDKGPYSNYEIDLLFRDFLRFNEKVVRELGEGMAYNPDVLRYMVQNSQRQSAKEKGGTGTYMPVTPSIEMLRSGTLGKDVPEGAPGDVSVPGYSPVGGEPPPSGQPTVRPGPQAKDVNLPQHERAAEDFLVEEAPKPPAQNWRQRRQETEKPVLIAANQVLKKPSIKLLAIAENAIDQAHGLKYVKELPELSGMLFKFQNPKVLSFWMQDTYIPLDIAFIDQQGIVVKTERMIPLSTRSVTSGRPCVMALEVPAGSLEKVGAKVGKKLVIDLENKTVSIDD